MFHATRFLAYAVLVVASVSGAAVKKPAKRALGSPIDLNTASPSDLQTLPGVGLATAKRIVAGRPYASVADLTRAGVSRKTIDTISSMVTTGEYPEASSTPTNSVPPPPTPGMVWVNLQTKSYHQEGSRWFGTTGKGKYMTEADAQRAGYQAAKD